MSDLHAKIELALRIHRTGDLRRAEALYQQLLQANAEQPDALHMLGVIALQLGRDGEAVRYIQQALCYRPNHAETHSNLGNALEKLGRLEEAAASFQNALRLRPDLAEVHCNLGNVRKQQGRLVEAVACCRNALRLKPDLVLAHINLGNALKELRELDEAVASYRNALHFNPELALAHNNLGNVLKDQGKLVEAVACYRNALRFRPDYAEAFNNLGTALEDLGRLEESEACLQRALQLRPDLVEAHNNLGNVLKRQVRLDEAAVRYRHALSLRPDFAVAHNNLGNVHKDLGELDEAVACYRHALRLRPDYAEAHSNLVYSLLFHPGYDSAAILREARFWHQRHAEPLIHFHRAHENNPDPNRRLRVGYVSPDFREHPISFVLMPILSNHDPGQVEVYGYAGVIHPDRITDRVRVHTDVWRNTVGLGDDRLAELIRGDRVDILVDLNLHMAGSRLLTFARRPAPVQVTWLGYPGTTGLSALGYRLTDPYLDPPGATDEHYTERSIRLPDTFWCYHPLADDGPEVGELPALTGEPFTFGCLNNFTKVNSFSLSLWAAVLRAVPGSRFLVLAPSGQARDRVRAHLEHLGIGAERVAFVDRQSRREYLRTYQRIDLCLDPLPYNGHNTSLDAAWMGVPTVTLVGHTIVGRAGLSLLHNLGLPELVARSPEEYVAIASGLASDRERLAGLRAGLRARIAGSSLMDGPRFARCVEAAYRTMWRDWCRDTTITASHTPADPNRG